MPSAAASSPPAAAAATPRALTSPLTGSGLVSSMGMPVAGAHRHGPLKAFLVQVLPVVPPLLLLQQARRYYSSCTACTGPAVVGCRAHARNRWKFDRAARGLGFYHDHVRVRVCSPSRVRLHLGTQRGQF